MRNIVSNLLGYIAKFKQISINLSNLKPETTMRPRVGTNDPFITFLQLPANIMQGFIVVPVVRLRNCQVSQCKFSWHRHITTKLLKTGKFDDTAIESVKGTHWLKVGDNMMYTPSVDDLNHIMKFTCIPSNGEVEGKPRSAMSTPIERGPAYRPLDIRNEFTPTYLAEPNQFRFMTYNILADLYADSEFSRDVLFAHCPAYALDIKYRKQLIIKEVEGYHSDVICMQEVDKKEFERAYEPFFSYRDRYEGIFHKKGDKQGEGCAIFYRRDKFDLINSHRTTIAELIAPKEVSQDSNQSQTSKSTTPIHEIIGDRESDLGRKCLSRFDHIRSAIFKNEALKKRFCGLQSILQTTLLRFKGSGNFLLIGNTHLYFAPDADHIRLLQGSVCIGYLEFMKEYYRNMLSASGDPNIRVMFCGDMNSSPDCGLYKLATTGSVDKDFKDWSSNEPEAVVGLELSTNLRLASAYKDISYTNYTPDFNGCLDYIYYETNGLTCESTVPLPEHEDVTAFGGIPSDVFPSDHLALVANMKI